METDAEMFTRSLRCPLTPDEVRERGGRLASLVGNTPKGQRALKGVKAPKGRVKKAAKKTGRGGR